MTHPTPAPTTPEAARQMANDMDEQRHSSFLRDEANALRSLADQCERLTKERDHWKANHDNQVEIKAAVLDRPDLGDRARKVQALVAERAALRVDLERARGELAEADQRAAATVQRITTEAYDVLYAGEPAEEREPRWKWVMAKIRELCAAQPPAPGRGDQP